MTTNILIELVRKVEDTPDLNQDIRTLAVSFLHRFRLDGIEKNQELSFSPTGFQFTKQQLIQKYLIPGNAVNFPNSTLTSNEIVSNSKIKICRFK